MNRLSLLLVSTAVSTSLHADDLVWDGGATQSGSNWSTSYLLFGFIPLDGYNWNPNQNPDSGDNLFFAGTESLTSNNNTAAGTAYAGLTFNSGAGAFILTGNRVTLGTNGVTNNSSNIQTINLPLTLVSGPATTFNSATANLVVGGVINGTGGLTKTGSRVLTLTGSNTYTGSTAVNAGTLVVNGNQSAATGALTVASGATLAGTGTIGGATTISGTHSAGTVGTTGTQTFSSTLNYASGSIFSWDLTVANPAATSSATTSDKITGTATGSGATFAIVLGNGSYADTFWNANHTWTGIFTSGNLGNIFSAFSGSGVSSTGLVTGQGQFSFSGGSLTWSVVPEPGNATAGLLVFAVLTSRRRR